MAKKYNVFIVEDDYLADLETDSKADPLYNLDNCNHVIYLKVIRRLFFEVYGLELRSFHHPSQMISINIKILDIDSPMISQAALEIYIKSGMFERHKNKIKSSYHDRSKTSRNIRKNS